MEMQHNVNTDLYQFGFVLQSEKNSLVSQIGILAPCFFTSPLIFYLQFLIATHIAFENIF